MKIVSNNINIIVNNDLFGDPSPHNLKKLKVEYSLDGYKICRIINEHEKFIADIFNVGTLEDILQFISENKNGVEIGGPSWDGKKILYKKLSISQTWLGLEINFNNFTQKMNYHFILRTDKYKKFKYVPVKYAKIRAIIISPEKKI